MTNPTNETIKDLKRAIRAEARRRRSSLSKKDERSQLIWEQLRALPEFTHAEHILIYLHVRNEVRTIEYVAEQLAEGRSVVIPWCDGDELELFRLEDFHELEPRTMGILEPRAALQRRADKRVSPRDVDLFVVPGLAFDLTGVRVGYGAGYFDRLLARSDPAATRIALAYQCQIFDSLPHDDHDQRMHIIVTERGVHAISR